MTHCDAGQTRCIGRFQFGQIFLPVTILVSPEVFEKIPGKDAAVVTIIENDPNGVVSYRFNGSDADVFFSGLKFALPRAVTAHFCGRGVDPEQLCGDLDTIISPYEFEGVRDFVVCDFFGGLHKGYRMKRDKSVSLTRLARWLST